MKKIYFLVCFWISSAFYINAQSNEPVNSYKDKINYQGHTVKLLPAMGGTYGYDIFQGKELLVHQGYNPFTMSPVALRNKQDVYKVAKWQINQLQSGKLRAQKTLPDTRIISGAGAIRTRKAAIINQPLPEKVAKELRINTQ